MTTGESIRHYRKKQHLTQAQLAERIGVTAQAVSKWERGAGLPDTAVLVPMARALGTTTDELLRFGQRRAEFEQMWADTLRLYGDDPEKLLEVAASALKEFPWDWQFTYRAAVSCWQISLAQAEEEDRQTYLGRARAYATLAVDLDPENSSSQWIFNEISKET